MRISDFGWADYKVDRKSTPGFVCTYIGGAISRARKSILLIRPLHQKHNSMHWVLQPPSASGFAKRLHLQGGAWIYIRNLTRLKINGQLKWLKLMEMKIVRNISTIGCSWCEVYWKIARFQQNVVQLGLWYQMYLLTHWPECFSEILLCAWFLN